MYDTMQLGFTLAPDTLWKPGTKTGFSIKITAVTNNYNTTEAMTLKTGYLYYTTKVYNKNGVEDTTHSRNSRTRFGTSTAEITITNTETVGNNVTPKTTQLNITGNIVTGGDWTVPEGTYCDVYIWYLTYNSQINVSEDYRVGGQIRVYARLSPILTPYD